MYNIRKLQGRAERKRDIVIMTIHSESHKIYKHVKIIIAFFCCIMKLLMLLATVVMRQRMRVEAKKKITASFIYDYVLGMRIEWSASRVRNLQRVFI